MELVVEIVIVVEHPFPIDIFASFVGNSYFVTVVEDFAGTIVIDTMFVEVLDIDKTVVVVVFVGILIVVLVLVVAFDMVVTSV